MRMSCPISHPHNQIQLVQWTRFWLKTQLAEIRSMAFNQTPVFIFFLEEEFSCNWNSVTCLKTRGNHWMKELFFFSLQFNEITKAFLKRLTWIYFFFSLPLSSALVLVPPPGVHIDHNLKQKEGKTEKKDRNKKGWIKFALMKIGFLPFSRFFQKMSWLS